MCLQCRPAFVPQRCETFIPSSVLTDPIHALCVVGPNLWVCTGNNTNAGTVVIFDLATATAKGKVGSVLGWQLQLRAGGEGRGLGNDQQGQGG